MAAEPVPGTAACYRIKDTSGANYAACGCGWWQGPIPSQRRAKRLWHAHLRRVRAANETAAAAEVPPRRRVRTRG